MKKTISLFYLLLFLITFPVFADEAMPVLLLHEGSIHYIFEARVNVREKASLSSKKVGLALMGERVKIVKKMEKREELYGLIAPWYEVEWQGKRGFIWGGLLSSVDVSADFDGDGQEEVLMSRALGDSYADRYCPDFMHGEIRLSRGGRLISDRPFEGSILRSSQFFKIEKKGFSPEVTLLALRWLVMDAVGGVGHREIYYLRGDKFQLLDRSTATLEHEDRDEVVVIYPVDKNGKTNILRLERRVTEHEVENSYEGYNYNYDVKVRDNELVWAKEFLWNGKDFTELK